MRLVEGAQIATVQTSNNDTLGDWSLAYPFNNKSYGRYTVKATLADQVGNVLTKTLGTVTVDDYAPTGDTSLTSLLISETTTLLEGVITDIPYPTENKVLHLHFEEAAGANDFVDSSRNHWLAECFGYVCPQAGEAGKHGKALRFTGNEDTIGLPNPVTVTNNSLTLMTWLKPTWNAGTLGYNAPFLSAYAS